MKKSEIRGMIKEELLKEAKDNPNFVPMYKLLKLFPGMEEPKGTIFGKSSG